VIVPDLAGAIAAALTLGKKVCVLVGTEQIAEEYKQAVERLMMQFHRDVARPREGGNVVVLVTSKNNGSEWKKERFDRVEVDPSAVEFEAWQDLAREAATRSVPVKGKPLPVPRALRHAIRRGRRAKTATEKDS
jgi:hypothetical protein